MKHARSAPSTGPEEFILIYSRKDKGTGRWKTQYYRESFFADDLRTAFREARTRWTRFEKEYRHRLPEFDSLSVRIDWDPTRQLARAIDPRSQLTDRRFLLRYRHIRTGINGSDSGAKRLEIRATSLREAYKLATDVWINRIQREPSGCETIGLYELLPWKP